jgi:hypothetical protein
LWSRVHAFYLMWPVPWSHHAAWLYLKSGWLRRPFHFRVDPQILLVLAPTFPTFVRFQPDFGLFLASWTLRRILF